MDPAAISSGIGQGAAQVFKPGEDLLGEALKAAQAKKAEQAKQRAATMEQLKKMSEFHIWTERDGDAFAKIQDGIWKDYLKKDASSPETAMWVNQQMQKLTFLADQSNTDKEYFKRDTEKIADNPDKYYPTAVEGLLDFADPSNALGAKTKYDPSWMAQRIDYDKAFGEMVSDAKTLAEANKQKLAEVKKIPGSQRRFEVETTTAEYPLEDAKMRLRAWVAEPNHLRSATERWQQMDKTGQYKDVYQWLDESQAPNLAIKSRLEDASQLSSGGGGGGSTRASQKWNISLAASETPEFTEQMIADAVGAFTKDAKNKAYYEKNKSKLPKITEDGKERTMTFNEYAEDQIRKTERAKGKIEGAVYDFGKAQGAGEASTINYLEIPTGNKKGIKFRPTQIYVNKGREPMIVGLNEKGNRTEVKYSDIVGKLRVETNNQWDDMKQQIISEQGFDPFARYEPKSGGAQPAAQGTKATEKTSKLTPEEWNKQWATLPKGQSMVGLDGKTYTKK